ncbi:YbjQ family protein [Uliginosibacterium sp. H1]|uniref:YbjQ family protein n=1 Tax=Uliginosibacterium sp. H1 TaxID=3114757 RepID=UPI002E176C11|nr:YbjQ family protein [Uliginosibacterium sp. H1]
MPPTYTSGSDILLSNLEIVPGRRIRTHLGVVQGSTVRAKHVGKDLLSGLKNIVGGELKAYTELMQEAREEASRRMVEQAESLGANAVLNIRYSTTSITAGAAEILAYGTAVMLE